MNQESDGAPGRQEITRERYEEALGVLRPVVWVDEGAYLSALDPQYLDDAPYRYPRAAPMFTGFLLGEPDDDRRCRVTGKRRATYRPYVKEGERFFHLDETLTIPEFLRLKGAA